MEHGDLELAGPRGDDRVGLRGQDQDGQSVVAQGGDPEPVTAVHGDGLASIGVDQHRVVGLGAVEVEYDRVDVVAGRARRRLGAALRRDVEQRGQGAGAGQVVRLVDLQDLGGVGAHQRGVAEETVLRLAEARGAHRVGGAGLQQVLRPVLAARAVGLVVVDAVAAGRGGHRRTGPAALGGLAGGRGGGTDLVGGVAPDEAVEGGHGHGRVSAVLHDRGGHAVDVLGGDERAGALDEQHHVRAASGHRLVGVHRVQDRGLAGRGVPGDGGRAQDDLGAGGAGRVGDGGIVGGDHDVGDEPGLAAGLHGAGDQRHAPDRGEVLAGYALRAAAGGNDGQHRWHGGSLRLGGRVHS